MSDELDLEEVFRAEAEEGLAQLTRGLLALEGARAEALPGLLREVFRAAHTLKGAASSSGQADFARVAHLLESALDQLRRGERAVDRALVDGALGAVDLLRRALGSPLAESELELVTQLLARPAAAAPTLPPAPSAVDLPAALMAAMDAVGAAVRSGSAADAASATQAVLTVAQGSGLARQRLGASLAKLAAKTTNRFDEGPARAVLQVLEVFYTEATSVLTEPELAATEALLAAEVEAATAQVPSPVASAAQPAAPVAPVERRNEARVPVQVLDRLLFGVDELHATRLRLDHQRRQVDGLIDEHIGQGGSISIERTALLRSLERLRQGLAEEVNQLAVVVGMVQADLGAARMAPVGPAVEPFRRVVRELSTQLGKEATLEVIGHEVRVDRRVLELARDALTQLIRNAIDHGLERPDERRAQQKPTAGQLRLSVEAREGHAWFTLSDDGRGVDLPAVRRVALARGLITAAQVDQLGLEQTLELLFAPGLSTSTEVSETSGRGVGLDVVRERAVALGGRVEVASAPGVGTAFSLVLPLTVSATRGLLFTVASERYCLPLTVVQELGLLEPNDLKTVDGQPVLQWRGQPLPFFDLIDLLRLKGAARRTRHVVVLTGEHHVALGVDRLLGEEEVVVKAMASGTPSIPLVMGAATLSDGSLVAVLDPQAMLRAVAKVPSSEASRPAAPAPVVVVVDDSLTTRTMMSRVLERAGYRVFSAPDAEAGYQVAQRERPALVVSDVEMPGMSGFELIAKLKADPVHSSLATVLVTSLDSAEAKAQGSAVGCSGYVVKSDFRPAEFLAMVAELVGRSA